MRKFVKFILTISGIALTGHSILILSIFKHLHTKAHTTLLVISVVMVVIGLVIKKKKRVVKWVAVKARAEKRIFGISVKSGHEQPMTLLESVQAIKEKGLVGNYRKMDSAKKRQVTVISLEQWQEACSEVTVALPWHERRAQICITGYHFGTDDVGKKIILRNGVILEITGETNPCWRMDQIKQGLKNALANWRGGVTCRILQGGILSKGESYRIE